MNKQPGGRPCVRGGIGTSASTWTRVSSVAALMLSMLGGSGCQVYELDYMDPEMMIEKALERRFAGEDTPVSEPVASIAAPGKMITIFTHEEWVPDYLGVKTDSARTLPVGTTLVREIYGETGEVEKLTVMVRADPELYTDLGGWVFGVFDPQGNVVMGDDGLPQMGELDPCVQCHLPQVGSQFLFGLPPS